MSLLNIELRKPDTRVLRTRLELTCMLCVLALAPFDPAALAQPRKGDAVQRTFISHSNSFRFRYQSSFILCAKSNRPESCETYIPICDETALACVAYPKARYAGTNFEGAAFSVTKQPDADTESKCLDSMKSPLDKESINGVEFERSDDSSAGMGHGLSGRTYKAFHNGQCYQLAIRIAFASSGGSTPGTIKEFTPEDEEKVRSTLKKILTSFKFLN
jgi:hypothetical protein